MSATPPPFPTPTANAPMTGGTKSGSDGAGRGRFKPIAPAMALMNTSSPRSVLNGIRSRHGGIETDALVDALNPAPTAKEIIRENIQARLKRRALNAHARSIQQSVAQATYQNMRNRMRSNNYYGYTEGLTSPYQQQPQAYSPTAFREPSPRNMPGAAMSQMQQMNAAAYHQQQHQQQHQQHHQYQQQRQMQHQNHQTNAWLDSFFAEAAAMPQQQASSAVYYSHAHAHAHAHQHQHPHPHQHQHQGHPSDPYAQMGWEMMQQQSNMVAYAPSFYYQQPQSSPSDVSMSAAATPLCLNSYDYCDAAHTMTAVRRSSASGPSSPHLPPPPPQSSVGAAYLRGPTQNLSPVTDAFGQLEDLFPSHQNW